MSGAVVWPEACSAWFAPQPDEPGECRAVGQRLENALAEGRLPMISLDYFDRLWLTLAGLAPRLAPFRHMLLLGIGGSALGALALQRAFAPGQNGPNYTGKALWVVDNVDGARLKGWLARLNPAETLVMVASKSGTTIETLSQFFLVRDWLARALGDAMRDHVIAVSDPTPNPLRDLAGAYGFLSLPVPVALGGRYSVVSPVGLVPAVFLGVDWQNFLSGAQGVMNAFSRALADPARLGAHAAWKLSTFCGRLMKNGYLDLVFFSYIPSWSAFGDWFAQLWAESLGKDGRGSMPIPAIGVTDQHSLLQMFLDGPRNKGCLLVEERDPEPGARFSAPLPAVFSWLENHTLGDILAAEALATRLALSRAGVPLARLVMGGKSEREAGELMALSMLTTILAGVRMGVNPLDQPAVEEGKLLARARLGAPGCEAQETFLDQALKAPDESVEFGG